MRGITTNNQISNLPVFRLPEMYLIQAEAYAKQSTPDYGKAKEKLLEVAAKRNPDLDDNEIAEDQTVIDATDKERKLELVQEGHRFFDARRLGKIISVADGSYTNLTSQNLCTQYLLLKSIQVLELYKQRDGVIIYLDKTFFNIASI